MLRVCGIRAQRDRAALHFIDEGEQPRAIRSVGSAIFFAQSIAQHPSNRSANDRVGNDAALEQRFVPEAFFAALSRGGEPSLMRRSLRSSDSGWLRRRGSAGRRRCLDARHDFASTLCICDITTRLTISPQSLPARRAPRHVSGTMARRSSWCADTRGIRRRGCGAPVLPLRECP